MNAKAARFQAQIGKISRGKQGSDGISPGKREGETTDGEGFEQTHKSLGNTNVSIRAAHKAAHSNALPNDQAPTDSRLKDLVHRWPTLSEADRKRIAKIVGGAT